VNNAPRPSSWPSVFLGACLSILLGAWALSWAISMLTPTLPWLAGGFGVVIGIRVWMAARRRRDTW
jgi:hypothetical protein